MYYLTQFKKNKLIKEAYKQDLYRFIAVLVFSLGLLAFCLAFTSYNDALINLYL